jgi:hypothetical protein
MLHATPAFHKILHVDPILSWLVWRMRLLLQKLVASMGSPDSGRAVAAWAAQGLYKEDADAGAESLLSQTLFSRRHVALEAAGAILQLAPPEAVFEVQINLPTELSNLYLNKQEHFDLMKVVLNTDVPRRGSNGSPVTSESAALDAALFMYV